jgi:hypothetical protein
MKKRSPAAVFLLSLITLGIYGIVWSVKTKNEMNNLGANIPTAWLLIVPIVGIWWTYKYCEGVEKVTGGKTSTVLSFVLLILLGYIGAAIIQNEFNKVAEGGVAGMPTSSGLPLPDNSFGGPAATPPQVSGIPPTQPVAPVASPTPVQPVTPTPPPAQPAAVTPPAGNPFPPADPSGTVITPTNQQQPPQPPQTV